MLYLRKAQTHILSLTRDNFICTFIHQMELTGNKVKLRRLTINDKDGLIQAASDGELWNLPYTSG